MSGSLGARNDLRCLHRVTRASSWRLRQVVTQKAYQFALLHLLAAQRSSVLLAAAKRSTLLGLGWPFTDWRNKSTSGWVKPYWTAGAYMVSPAGAKTLLATYWPDAPSMGAGVVIDTRSQKYAGADQLLFNSSDAYVGAPLVVKHEQGVCKRWKPDCTREVVWDLEVRSRSRRFVLLSYYGSLWPKLNLSSVPLRVVALAPPAAIAIAQGAASSSGFGDEQASTAGVLSRIPFHRLVPVAQSGPRPIRTVMRTAREAGAVEGWVGGPAAPRYTLLIDADVVTLGTFGGATGPSTNLSGGADLRRLASTRSAPIVEAQPETPTARAVKRLIQEAVLHATTTMPRSNSDIGMLVQRYGGPTRCNRECDPLFSSLKLLDAEEGDAIAKYAYGRAISLVAKLEAAELLANAPNLPQCCDPPGGRGGRARRMAALLVRTERFDAVAEAVAKADAQCSPHNAEGGSGQCDDSWEATMIRLGAVSASWFDRQGE